MKEQMKIIEPRPGSYRILHCIDNLGRGGAESQLVQTLLNMDNNRFENYVCYLRPPSDLEAAIVRSGLPVTNLNISSPRSWLRAILRLKRLVREHHIELIHASTSYSNVYAPIVGAIEHIPVLFTLTTTHDAKTHGETRSSFFRQFRVKNFYSWRAFLLKTTRAKIIAISNTVKESAIKDLRIPADRITVVYRGLTVEDYHPEHHGEAVIETLKETLGVTGAYPILLNVGRLWPVKCQKDLVQAMPAVKKHFPNARLLIAGQGPLKAELEELRDRLGLYDSVKFLGLRDDISLLLELSDLYVGASYLEGLGNAVVEAMAAGKPVVAYDIPVWDEILRGKAGILVESRKPDLLAAEIARLAADPEKMRIRGSWGVQIARDNFVIRVNTKKLENIYEKILGGVASKHGRQRS